MVVGYKNFQGGYTFSNVIEQTILAWHYYFEEKEHKGHEGYTKVTKKKDLCVLCVTFVSFVLLSFENKAAF